MSNNPQQPQTRISRRITQGVRTVVHFTATALQPNAKVPEIWVKNPQNPNQPEEKKKLFKDKYTLGRSNKCDITVTNDIVSHTHLSLIQHSQRTRCFILKDENSSNGIYIKKRRVTKPVTLYHGDRFSLGKSQLKDAVQIKYHNPPPWWVLWLRYFLSGTGGIFALFCLWIGYEWSKIDVKPIPETTRNPVLVLDRNGQKLSSSPTEAHRELKQLDDFSPHLVNALLASEDSRYYWHFGVDPIGIVRAVKVSLEDKDIKQGASTITQQLARSLYANVGRENTARRKVREIITALKLEAVYSKDEILKTYLNRVYLGVGKYGFEDAAQFYFDKSASYVNISEAATLVAILPGPNIYNPVKDYDAAVQLRNRILKRMLQQEMITEEEEKKARRSRIEVSPKAGKAFSSNSAAPYFYDYVFQQLSHPSILGEDLAKEGNFIIETTLDIQIQEKAEAALGERMKKEGSRLNFNQGALVTLDSSTGEILALIGGVNYNQSQYNRATAALRQPGSTFKVFAYAAAIEKGISPYKLYSCAPLTWKGQKYKNCERSGTGAINMYQAVAQSENSVALRVAQDVGLKQVVDMAQRLGVKSKLNPVPGLVLGQSEVNVLEITGAYATFANGGTWYSPHPIQTIRDSSDCDNPQDYQTCRIIYSFENEDKTSKKVLDRKVAATITSLLQGVVSRGTGGRAKVGRREAGKTGTTNKNVDLWFIGYLPSEQLVTGIWLGNDNNKPTQGSSSQAAALWGQYMKTVTSYQ